jgi:5-methylcytosine-specific restriction endonuclease McrA
MIYCTQARHDSNVGEAQRMNIPVLVLNVNFEPLNICSTARAMGLLVVGKAETIQNGRGVICTPSRTYERPSVIRLRYMVHRPHPHVRLCKREIFRRDGFRCQYCGRPSAHLTLDHVIPRYRGGAYAWDNLVSACPQCNRAKGHRAPQEVGMTLRSRPAEPPATAIYLYSQYLQGNQEWTPYLEGW